MNTSELFFSCKKRRLESRPAFFVLFFKPEKKNSPSLVDDLSLSNAYFWIFFFPLLKCFVDVPQRQ